MLGYCSPETKKQYSRIQRARQASKSSCDSRKVPCRNKRLCWPFGQPQCTTGRWRFCTSFSDTAEAVPLGFFFFFFFFFFLNKVQKL